MIPDSVTVLRDRRATEADPYNPGRTRPVASWDDAATAAIPGAWVGTPSISALNDPARSATDSVASLYCDAAADVQQGDRIRTGGHAFIVGAVPMLAANPFTGWMPPLEIPVEEVHDR